LTIAAVIVAIAERPFCLSESTAAQIETQRRHPPSGPDEIRDWRPDGPAN
jgi:hypothetical protein